MINHHNNDKALKFKKKIFKQFNYSTEIKGIINGMVAYDEEIRSYIKYTLSCLKYDDNKLK